MGLMEKWKNRETKKKLREENIRLKSQLEANVKRPFPVMTVERNIQKVKFSMEVNQMDLERGIPAEYIKRNIVNGIAEYIEPLIEYDFCDMKGCVGKVYTGTLYVATGDRHYERKGFDS